MPTVLERKLEHWENELLDLGKRNKMIHYRETKRSTIKLVDPPFDELFQRIVIAEEELTFKRPVDRNSDLRTFSMLALLENLSHPIPVSIGDIDTASGILERQKTLKNLRSKARLALDEQGMNILYMIAGFIEWRENAAANNAWVKSPLVLVPVSLSIESVNAPFVLKRYEEDVVVNPTLMHLFRENHGIALPSFDPDEQTIEDFLKEMEDIVYNRGWKVSREISLGLLSFLKINMYRDLQNNRDRILNNTVLQAISGSNEVTVEADMQLANFNHDSIPPQECFQVVNADASQQDAILLSRKGVSFVMQGPPGTGKSQTITNIIAQALADGKKVLFVSEKMAALQVVYRRLQEVHLSDFCLPLHSHKANKKEVIAEIGQSLDLQLKKVKDEAISDLYTLDIERQRLNKYVGDLHSQVDPLGMSIYQVYGILSNLASASEIAFDLHGIEKITKEQLLAMQYGIVEYASAIDKMRDGFRENPWHGSNVKVVTYDLKEKISSNFTLLANEIADLHEVGQILKKEYSFDLLRCWNDFVIVTEILSTAVKMSGIPVEWILNEDLDSLLTEATKNNVDLQDYRDKRKAILQCYSHDVFDVDAQDIQKQIADTRLKVSAIVAQPTLSDTAYSTYLNEINDSSASLIEALHKIETDISLIRSATGYSPLVSFENIIEFYKLAQLVSKSPKLTTDWFTIKELAELKKIHSDAKTLWSEFTELQNEILSYCKPSIFDLPAQQIHNDLQSYQNTATRVLAFYQDNKKTGSMTLELLHQFITEIKPEIDSIQQAWTNASSANQVLADTLEFPKLSVCADIEQQITICEAALHPLYPQASWAEVDRTSKSLELLKKCQATHNHIKELKQEILLVCDAAVFDLDYAAILTRYKTEYTNIFKWLKPGYYEDRKAVRRVYKHVVSKLPDHQIILLLQNLKSLGDEQVWLDSNVETVVAFTGRHYQGADTDWDKIFNSVTLFKQLFPLFNSAEDAVRILSITSEEVIKSVQKYLSYLKQLQPIIEIGYSLQEISTELSQEKISELIERLNSMVKKSMEFESLFDVSLLHFKNNHSYESLIESFGQLVTYDNRKAIIDRYESNLSKYFIYRYEGANTDWDQIAGDIDFFERIQDYYSDFPIEALKKLLLEQNPEKVLSNLHFNATEDSVNSLLEQLNSIVSEPKTKQYTLYEALGLLEDITRLYARLKNCYVSLSHLTTVTRSWEDFDEDLEDLLFIKNIDSYYKEQAETLANRYKDRFCGIKTDWDMILAELYEVKKFKHLLLQYKQPIAFGEAACTQPEVQVIINKVLSKTDAFEDINNQMCFVDSLFDEPYAFSSTIFEDVYHRLLSCLNSIDLLEKYIDYRDTRKVCCESGLESFVDAIESKEMLIPDILDAFKQGFYKKWLDYATNISDAVSSFRTRAQEERVTRFCNLDNRQLQIAQMRIREKLISNLPSKHRFLAAKDELSVLQKELGKKGRFMPLRKLFRTIPNLLLRLKPCLMMSPLSVSHFLEAETYRFDIVIFDEASQIFPEDAIGAIFRGAQVIIAGDSKQLPPTNFFSTKSGSVYDGADADSDSDEEIDDIVSDSILEEAAATLPNRSLLWHYRSRHEHLIAFSNREIYKNQLITFPSSIDRKEDMGVEYFYVPTGVYEGRCNTREAEMCVMLIQNHIEQYPYRSLGIVAFSEKQQSTIEEFVDKFRTQNPKYEEFFDENRDEPFFIKNLENVQGDERDTIIFSICYAKDSNGKMYMRFGPLGRSGGERRLNVAVTRAKFNVKLVGSILPTDIDLSRLNSEGGVGVKMLRSYIKFAMNGTNVFDAKPRDFRLEKEDNDSFCESVAAFLEDNGYKLSRNVGCSDYTINIAIEHPDHPGHFAAGIECDGNTYVMAKTARDRDHLRSSILRSLGWKLYRVWSTDWIRNPEEAKQNLIAFVEEALTQPVNILAASGQEAATGKPVDTGDILEKPAKKSTQRSVAPSFKLKEYKPALWSNAEFPPDADNDVKIETLILYVVGLEQPIHRNLIHRRLAGAFGNVKVTSSIKYSVDLFLKSMQETQLKNENDFFSLQVFTETPLRKAGGRSIEQISVREISGVMIQVAKNTFGISIEELIAETTKLFGFERKGPIIKNSMAKTVDSLITNGTFKIVDEKVQVTEE